MSREAALGSNKMVGELSSMRCLRSWPPNMKPHSLSLIEQVLDVSCLAVAAYVAGQQGHVDVCCLIQLIVFGCFCQRGKVTPDVWGVKDYDADDEEEEEGTYYEDEDKGDLRGHMEALFADDLK